MSNQTKLLLVRITANKEQLISWSLGYSSGIAELRQGQFRKVLCLPNETANYGELCYREYNSNMWIPYEFCQVLRELPNEKF